MSKQVGIKTGKRLRAWIARRKSKVAENQLFDQEHTHSIVTAADAQDKKRQQELLAETERIRQEEAKKKWDKILWGRD